MLHDAVLQHFFLGLFDEYHYVDEFVYNYGEWMRALAGELWSNRARSAADPRYFECPMLKRIASVSARGDRSQSGGRGRRSGGMPRMRAVDRNPPSIRRRRANYQP